MPPDVGKKSTVAAHVGSRSSSSHNPGVNSNVLSSEQATDVLSGYLVGLERLVTYLDAYET